MWFSRQAIVVNGGESGYIHSPSTAHSPTGGTAPGTSSPAGRTVHASGTGSHQYSSSVTPPTDRPASHRAASVSATSALRWSALLVLTERILFHSWWHPVSVFLHRQGVVCLFLR